MRKIVPIITVISILLTLNISAFAAENSSTVGENGSQNIDITAKTTVSSVTTDCYSVDITWTNMTFTYKSNETKTWDASNHSYSSSTISGWDKTEASIAVTNHSNVEVDVTISYTPVEGTGVTGAIQNGTGTLAAGEEGKYDSADSMTAVLTIDGTPTEAVTSNGVKIGSITVTVQ